MISGVLHYTRSLYVTSQKYNTPCREGAVSVDTEGEAKTIPVQQNDILYGIPGVVLFTR